MDDGDTSRWGGARIDIMHNEFKLIGYNPSCTSSLNIVDSIQTDSILICYLSWMSRKNDNFNSILKTLTLFNSNKEEILWYKQEMRERQELKKSPQSEIK